MDSMKTHKEIEAERRSREVRGGLAFVDRLMRDVWSVAPSQWTATATAWEPPAHVTEDERAGWYRAQWILRRRLTRIDLAALRGDHMPTARYELHDGDMRQSVKISIARWAAEGRKSPPESSWARTGRTRTRGADPQILAVAKQKKG